MIELICIIVSFNRRDKLETSIQYCLKNGASKVIIIDNNSKSDVQYLLDGLVDEEKLFIVRNTTNIGATAAFYQGITFLPELAKTDSAVVTFLDDDAYISETFIHQLSDLDISNRFIAPKVTDVQGNLLLMNKPLIDLPESLYSTVRYLIHRPTPTDFNKPQKIRCASFVGLTMKVKLAYQYKQLLPKDFFLYNDDVYFTASMTKNLIDGEFVPQLHVLHDTNDKRRAQSSEKLFFIFRNGVITHHLMSRKWWWIIISAKTIHYALHILADDDKHKIKRIGVIFKAISNGYSKLSEK
ncbi:glycosyltransferase [Photobacterium sp. MCCC 1A19761]|uniref:glycosyltransferase n=1 Tax=Photobacterium sp. MCCC 1A19761 TaxID=3115000 RepID=UPI00307F4F59